MSRVFHLFCLLGLGILASVSAHAYTPTSDGRVRTIDYIDGAIIPLQSCLGFQTMITLADDETIENIALGEASQWQVTPNKRGNLVFIKPYTQSAFTNMNVVSDKRTYAFELRVKNSVDCKRGAVIYELRFTYPEVVPQTHTDKDKPTDQNLSSLPEKRNTAYTFSGSRELVPLRMFDDGTSTYLLWAEGTDFPAIYAIADQKESLVNFGYREGYIVIDQVAPAFILRRAELRAVLYNDNYIPPALDALSPQPRPEVSHRKRPKGLFGRSSDPTQNKRPN